MVVSICSILTWASACLIFEKNIIVYLLKVSTPFSQGGAEEEYLDHRIFWLKPLLAAVLVPVAWRTDVKLVGWCSNYAMAAMYCAGAFEIIAACTYAYSKADHREPILYFGNNLSGGVYDMVFAWLGMSILPYIVAEMIYPQNAVHVINKACGNITIFYFTIAVVCYCGWGSGAAHRSPISQMVDLAKDSDASRFYEMLAFRLCAAMCFFSFMVKAGASFPLFLWPLVRELEALVAHDESPLPRCSFPGLRRVTAGRGSCCVPRFAC